MTSPKKQHYVPKWYLRNFSSNGKTIYSYDKVNGKSYPTNVNDIAQENCFYDLLQSGQKAVCFDSKQVEKALADVDSIHAGMYPKAIRRLRDNKKLLPSQRDLLAEV